MTKPKRTVNIGQATLYLADCAEITPLLATADSVVSDPPYGMNWKADSTGFSGGETPEHRGRGIDWGKIEGDDKPFDPTPWLLFDQVILWGSNHYQLPVGTSLVWIKRNEKAFGTFLSDAELGWQKGGHGVYCFKDVSMNGAGANFTKYHPTQKPVRLMEWCVTRTSGQVLDPFMGSGTTGVACATLGRPFVGVESNERYFDAACERITGAYRQGRLFG